MVAWWVVWVTACGSAPSSPTVITFSGSVVGREAAVLDRQLDRFMRQHPDVRVEVRQTPDAADLRHQLYVQWLNAGVSDPDVLQLDVIWPAEFSAAGWILPLDRFEPDTANLFPATLEANRWRDRLYGVPWFVDVGMLYWRTDLLDGPPASFAELTRVAATAVGRRQVEHGLVWQGARYEGLVCVFLEHLGGFGGRIIDASGRVAVDSPPAIRALEYMRDALHADGIVPLDALTWQEEQTRFAFQTGRAALMRNWPYAHDLLADPTGSEVAGRFAVAPMPASPEGRPTATLGGAQLAINARSERPEVAFALVEFLTEPAQLIERARLAGHYPPRRDLYDDPALAAALDIPRARLAEIRAVIDGAVPRPATPIYTELSEILQVHLHEALTRQTTPAVALRSAAGEMRALMRKYELSLDGTN